MQHLSQIIAITKDKKDKATRAYSAAENKFNKSGIYTGLSRTYRPYEEDGEQFPPESTRVQEKIPAIIGEMHKHLASLFDVIGTTEWTNCEAKADIKIDNRVLLADVPATYLLFLEKQVAELLAFVKKIPVLDASEQWHHDEASDVYATDPIETIRTKKSHKPFVLYQATKEHPAQVQVLAEDIPVGRWKTVKFSSALPAQRVNEMIDRLEKLQEAVKCAREEANRHEIVPKYVGDVILSYIFGER
jgi:hypothetical protein